MVRLLSLASMLAFGAAAPADSSPGFLTGPALGEPAPDFALHTLDGKPVTLAQYRGKTLVLNVWATWCPPCRLETPDLGRAARELRPRGVEFLGVDITEDAPIVRAFVAAKGVPYAQAVDRTKAFDRAYDVQSFPTTYVIDPRGILRARYLDMATTGQLRSFVAVAQAGRNVAIGSPLQSKIDALLAGPAFSFAGDAKQIAAHVKRAGEAIAEAERLMDESDAANGNAVDVLRTRAAEAALRDRAIAALEPVAASDAERAQLARLKGDSARDREHWSDAASAYRAALAIAPDDTDALEGLALSAGRLEQYEVTERAQERLVALQPESVDALVALGITLGKLGRAADVSATYARAIALARRQVVAKGSPAAMRHLAWAYLYQGRTLAKLGATDEARASFASMLEWSRRLPKSDERYAMYLEEGQEALVALDLSGSQARTALSLGPWTGPELPGSVPDTLKYRLIVAGPAGRAVALRADGVPKEWVASFCTDGRCAPFRVDIAIPSSGVKVLEFQLVPPAAGARIPFVRVVGNDGTEVTSAGTTP